MQFYIGEKKLDLQKQISSEENTDIATTYHNTGVAYNEKEDFANALFYKEKALKIREKLLGEMNLSTATSYRGVGQM